MTGHGVVVATRANIAVAPRPNKFHKHFDVIEPVACGYADLYALTHGWPVTPEGLETFISDNLDISFFWEEAEEELCEFYARYDPLRRTIIFNTKHEWIPEQRPDLYISFLCHELGHVILRHGEALDLETTSLFDEVKPVHFLNHPTMRPREVSEELLKRALQLSHTDPRIAAALRVQAMPERYEPQWMYDQAQHFAGAFIVPQHRVKAEAEEEQRLYSWSGIHQLAKRFGCSNSFMEVRLKKLGMILVQGNHVRPSCNTGQLQHL